MAKSRKEMKAKHSIAAGSLDCLSKCHCTSFYCQSVQVQLTQVFYPTPYQRKSQQFVKSSAKKLYFLVANISISANALQCGLGTADTTIKKLGYSKVWAYCVPRLETADKKQERNGCVTCCWRCMRKKKMHLLTILLPGDETWAHTRNAQDVIGIAYS